MQHALTTSVGRFALLGAALLALGAAGVTTRDHVVTYRMVLHAPQEPDAIYLTSWRHGAITLTVEGEGELQPLTYRTRAHVFDGCYWQGTETLVPLDERTFSYDYTEQILSCELGAVPTRPTPRSGIVTLEPR